MMTKIFHQIWNQRWHNSWIFAEILVIAIFLWMLIDPLYIIYATKAIPDNYEKEDRYFIELKCDGSEDNNLDVFRNVLHKIEKMPEVENHITTMLTTNFNAEGTMVSDALHPDLNKEVVYQAVQAFHYLWNGNRNVFHTLGLKDANSGKLLTVPENIDTEKQIFVSKTAAINTFGTTNVIGRKPQENYEIIGVYEDYQINDYVEPLPSIIYLRNIEEDWFYSSAGNKIIVKLKKGTNRKLFTQKLNNLLNEENLNKFIKEIELLSIDEFRKNSSASKIAARTLRPKFIFSSFALVCIFLCMLGTFWTRMDNRRNDIGIMRSMGASRCRVVRQYITEAVILLTLAFVVGMPIVLHFVLTEGFAEPGVCDIDKENFTPNPKYGVNNFYIHFACVTAITYAAMLLITIVGTWIPVYRATRILPADALREE